MKRILAAILLLAGSAGAWGHDAPDYQRVIELLQTSETSSGEPIVYPSQKPAIVTSLIVTLMPGEETGWHQHGVPVYGYILEGEVTIDYEGQSPQTYRTGEALVDAMQVRHNGTNKGETPARILVVFMGAEGAHNVIRGGD